jgi:hypothetical protein
LVQRICKKNFTALLLTFAYMFLLVHNVVPHHHHNDTANVFESLDDHHHEHAHEHEHGHAAPNDNQPEKPVADPDHLLSNHQHPFADNTTFHTQESNEVKISKRQVVPVLICFLNFHYSLFHLPDKKPPASANPFFIPTFFGPSHALRGPPVS